MRSFAFYFFLLLLSLCFINDATSSKIPNSIATNDLTSSDIAFKIDSLFQVLSTRRGFNGNVLIAQDGKVLYENAFGFADLKQKTPLNIESVFQIASITKQFTAMAIMMLFEEGKLNFTDTLQRFFPEFPYRNITIRQLLTHRSGLPEYMSFARRYWKSPKHLMNNNDVMDMLITHHPGLVFLPDRKYKYNNTGYVILACIVEQVSGLQFHTFLEKRIFIPLGMSKTFIYNTKNMSDVKYQTLGYMKNKRRAEEDYLSGVIGDKGIYSTIDDMFKWDQALYTEQLVRQTTLQEAYTPFSYNRKRDNSYGYGWRITTADDSSKIVYHAGLWRGYSSMFVRRLHDKTTIIVLCNKVNWSFENIDRFMGILDSAKHNVSSAGGD
jgi:CubicO group peptidase (beta-lactamase class C family)